MRKEKNKRGANPRPYRMQRITEPATVIRFGLRIKNPRSRKTATIKHRLTAK